MGTHIFRKDKKKVSPDAGRILKQIETLVGSVETSFTSLISVVREAIQKNVPLGKWLLNPWVDMAMKVIYDNVPEKLARPLVGCSPLLRRSVLALSKQEKDKLAKEGTVDVAVRGSDGKYKPEPMLLTKVPDRLVRRVFVAKHMRSFDEQVKALNKRSATVNKQIGSYDYRSVEGNSKVEIYTVSTGRAIMVLDVDKLVAILYSLTPTVAEKVISQFRNGAKKAA